MTDVSEPGPGGLGVPGASARREYARRRAQRHEVTRRRHPRIGGLLLALQREPHHETAWVRGAEGEERVAKSLARRLDDPVVLLHDLGIPGTRANIDHIAVARSGVWVIDTKRYKGKVAVSQPLCGTAKLTIARRDRTQLIDALEREVANVRRVVAAVLLAAPVHGALCFVEADLPPIGRLDLNGCLILYPRALAKRINRDGPLKREQISRLATTLAARFPPA